MQLKLEVTVEGAFGGGPVMTGETTTGRYLHPCNVGGEEHEVRLGTWESRPRCSSTSSTRRAAASSSRVDPVFLDAANGFAEARARYLGDLYPASGAAEPGVSFRDFFQTDREGVEKGVVLVDLRSLP